VGSRSQRLDPTLDEDPDKLEIGQLFIWCGPKLSNLLHQRLRGPHLFLRQFVPPRHPGTNGAGRSKFIKTEALAGEEFVLGIKPLRPPARIVFGRLEVEVIDVLAHLAVEAASLVILWAPDDENHAPERPMGLDPQKTLAECDEARDVQNGVGIQIVELSPISKKKTSKERMQGKREPPEEECKEKYSESRRWPGYDLRTGGENFHRIVLQKANLLGAR
jgi:hypothetical protein